MRLNPNLTSKKLVLCLVQSEHSKIYFTGIEFDANLDSAWVTKEFTYWYLRETILVSAKFPPCKVTFVVSGVFQRVQCWLTWMYYLLCTCFCEVEISLPQAETSTSNNCDWIYLFHCTNTFLFQEIALHTKLCINVLKFCSVAWTLDHFAVSSRQWFPTYWFPIKQGVVLIHHRRDRWPSGRWSLTLNSNPWNRPNGESEGQGLLVGNLVFKEIKNVTKGIFWTYFDHNFSFWSVHALRLQESNMANVYLQALSHQDRCPMTSLSFIKIMNIRCLEWYKKRICSNLSIHLLYHNFYLKAEILQNSQNYLIKQAGICRILATEFKLFGQIFKILIPEIKPIHTPTFTNNVVGPHSYYRPQRSCEGYVFTGMCLSTGGGVPDQVHPPGPGTTPPDHVLSPRTRYTPPEPGTHPGKYNRTDQVHPWDQVHPPRTRYTPWAGTPPRPGTPPGKYNPPDQVHPPG